jgi:aryl-alcohol dehydrogenase
VRISAAVCREATGFPAIETLELEPPRAGEVLVRLVAVGVCHTDIRVATKPMGPRPFVLGHEGAGVVEAVGEGVTELQPGQPVLMSYAFCGHCPACEHHAKPYCREAMPRNFGGTRPDGSSPLSKDGEVIHGAFFGQSSFATHAICEAHQLIEAPADLPLEVLAPLGCGVQTGAGAVLNTLKLAEGQSIAVFGAGSVGLSAVMAAKVAGASRIVAVDINPARLTLARELGATDVIDARAGDPVAAIRDLTGNGVDFALNTTDVEAVYQQGIACLGPRGVFAFVTAPGSGPELPVNLSQLMLGGRSIRGLVQGDAESGEFIPRLIELYRAGRFPLEKLITVYPFEKIAEAMHDSETGKAVKPVLRM